MICLAKNKQRLCLYNVFDESKRDDLLDFGFKTSKKNLKDLPVHIGIIMDGNGRWAKKRALPRSAGHKAGANNFRSITKYCSKIGIKYLTVYAFSTENWKRPISEVDFLMKLFKKYLNECLEDFKEENIKVIFLGDKSSFSEDLIELMNEVEEASKNSTGMTLNIAMNYGGRKELLNAFKNIAKDIKDNKIEIDDINEEMISENLYTKFQPDPDLIIRPSGEYRVSNFLLWQSAYSEYVFMNKLWPDFKEKDLEKAINEYRTRNRRFGGI